MIEVVAALIWDNGRFMICQRPENKARGLLWEFAGGKVEIGETKTDALIRECREELAITVDVCDEFMTVMHEYPDISVHLTLFNALIKEGIPTLIEHNDLKWITPAEIPNYDFCPADEEILSRIISTFNSNRMLNIHIATCNDREAVFALRFEVFVDEQNVPREIELDDEDAHAIHIIAEEQGVAVGCARVILSNTEAHIGRLAVKKAYRSNGIGSQICRFIINLCNEQGIRDIWLNSQLQAVSFYEKLGFVPIGDIFIEAEIKHIKMIYFH